MTGGICPPWRIKDQAFCNNATKGELDCTDLTTIAVSWRSIV
jgi:hypothetical protein